MIASVASVNSAQRIKQKILSENRINIRIMQTPSSLAKDGCGYSLKFDDIHKSLIVSAAASLGINIRRFYREVPSEKGIIYVKE